MPDFISITDFDAPELDVYARLSENQLVRRDRPEEGLFIAESPMVVARALDAGLRPVSMLLQARLAGQQAALLARLGDIPVYTAELPVLERLTGFALTRGMLCAMRRPACPEPAALISGLRRIAVLEDVMNPTNVGAIFRSAAALGVEAVLLTAGCSDPLYRRAVRVSMGTVFQLPWTWLPDAGWTELLRGSGFRTAAMALCGDSVPVYEPELARIEKLAVVLGTEGEGLARTTIAACDYTVRIPMQRGVDSLNVAAASAVAFYQLASLPLWRGACD